MKNRLFLPGLLVLSGLIIGLILGSQIGISLADTLGRFVKIETSISAYSPSPHITDSTPFQMASGRIAKPIELEQLKFVALSRDLLENYNIQYGDKIWISFEVQDKMGPKAEQGVDIFFRSLNLARKFGRQNRTIIVERRK